MKVTQLRSKELKSVLATIVLSIFVITEGYFLLFGIDH